MGRLINLHHLKSLDQKITSYVTTLSLLQSPVRAVIDLVIGTDDVVHSVQLEGPVIHSYMC